MDLELYDQAMSRLPALLRRTHSPRVVPCDGGFAGLFELDFATPLFARKYERPVLIAATDGVGTKLKIAQRIGKHDSIGIDLVAMCANDAICFGAELLFFLDYIVLGEDNPMLVEQIVHGISQGCIQCDCALVGGETAIHPGDFEPGHYDLAGFCVGVVERKRIIDGSAIDAGDCILGVASSGLHSNGFSLVRNIVFERAGLEVDHYVDECGATVGELLLTPTTLYVRPVRQVLARYRVKNVVHGIAHITGGGLRSNLERILPPGAKAVLDRDSAPVPPVFPWLQKLGDVDSDEMERVFNMGIGLVLVVSPHFAHSIQHQLADCGLDSWVLGRIEGDG